MRALALSPAGRLYLDAEPDPDGASLAPPVAARIEAAFEGEAGAGLFHLGAVEVESTLAPTYTYFRDLGRDLVIALRAESDLEELRERVTVAPAAERLEQLVLAAPPMKGAEYVTAQVLRGLWDEALAFFRADIAKRKGTVASYLQAKNTVWNLVGRVFFHLAENKATPETPFAFLATYTTRVSSGAKPQHRPLGRALEEFAGAKDKKAMLALLGPVQRAGEKSALVKAMVDAGEIYHPLAWTAGDAYAFLKEVPALEESGVVVRVPDWWKRKQPPRPTVRAVVGAKSPSMLGADALLDFAVDVTLDGERLTPAELAELLQGTGGLSLFKGRWVEIDKERLGAVLDHWKTAEKAARRDGLTFLEGMRLLSGMTDEPSGAEAQTEDGGVAWSRVEAGPWLSQVLDGLRSPEGLAAIEPGDELRAELRPYQRVGLKWLYWLQQIGLGGCLADDMGLGKTVQVLALLLSKKKSKQHAKDGAGTEPAGSPSLLVVPASLLGNWLSEAARFAPSLEILSAHPSALSAAELQAMPGERVRAADVVLTTYGTLPRVPWLAAQKWDLVIVDEAQAIKNPGAKQTRAVKALSARTRLALTGTPVENRLGDLWSIFDFVAPGLLGTAKDFGRATKQLAKREHDAYAPLRRLVRPYILRRLKTDKRVIADLPDKTELAAFCPLTKRQAALYAEAVAALKDKLGSAEGIERRGAVLAALMRFKQICNHPSQWTGDGIYDPADSGKLGRLRELCEPLAERQDKVLVFTQFREMTEPLSRFLAGIFGRSGLVLHGGTAVKDRKKLVDAFQSDEGPPFFVLSIKAGGTGLNLTAASHVIHFDRWWNPAVENQATDRAYRIGQKRNVVVHKFVCRGTVEERIDALIASKVGLSKDLLEGESEIPLTEMSNEALLRFVSLDIGSALEESS